MTMPWLPKLMLINLGHVLRLLAITEVAVIVLQYESFKIFKHEEN